MSSLTRREFLSAAALPAAGAPAARPNILWITCEDLSPVLGCYGEKYARTPNLDRLAAGAVRYTRAFSTASVCAPARSCIITGVHATSLGTMHLRGLMPLARQMRCFTEYLRDAGYYCSNNVKEDYNFQAPRAWDESSNKAHWRKRGPGQPFFGVFNLTETHQGQIRYSREEFEKIEAGSRPDPAAAPLPPYYPDTPDIRLNLAILHAQVTRMDRKAGEILEQLRADGLDQDTIVFFYSDHGTALPRGKRWLFDTGTRVPLLVRFPGKWKHLALAPPGSVTDRMVSFEDLAPTVLSLAGLDRPAYMRGTAFLGTRAGKAREYVYTARDRVDEVIEISRAVFDGRYRYIRNYLPHRPRMQHSAYSELGHVRKEVRRLAAENKLKGDTAYLAASAKPAEELYDFATDPWEMKNLAASPAHRQTLEKLRKQLRLWMTEIRDTGFLPEQEMRARSGAGSAYDMARDGKSYPFDRVLDAAEHVGRGPERIPELRKLLKDSDAAVRYWAAVALVALGPAAAPAKADVEAALNDRASSVRIAAAEAMLRLGGQPRAMPVLERALQDQDACVRLQAAIVFWYAGDSAKAAMPALRAALKSKSTPDYQHTYFEWAVEKILSR